MQDLLVFFLFLLIMIWFCAGPADSSCWIFHFKKKKFFAILGDVLVIFCLMCNFVIRNWHIWIFTIAILSMEHVSHENMSEFCNFVY
jgi:hypothetical protein